MAVTLEFAVRYNHVSMMLHRPFLAESLANDDIQLVVLDDAERFDECREGCLALLKEPDLGHVTRVQTLHVASGVSHPAEQHAHLKEAERLLEEMDANLWEVRMLKSDSDEKFAMLEWFLRVNGKVGLPLESLCYPHLGGQHGALCVCDTIKHVVFVSPARIKEEGK